MNATSSNAVLKKLFLGCLVFAVALTGNGCGGTGNTSGSSGLSAPVSVSLNQSAVNLTAGATTQFTATVAGSSNTAVTWSVDGVTGGNSTAGTISAAGLYTAPSNTGSHTVIATSVADSSATAKAAVVVGLVSITPASTAVAPGGTQQFSATIQGFSTSAVTWSVDQVNGGNSTVGTISASGTYAAPLQPGSHTVTATSVADTSAKASATLTVETISISPGTAVLAPASSEQFTATIPGVSNGSVNWSVDQVSGGNSAVGTITAGGLYTAPSQPGSYTITATSAANSLWTASVTVAVDTISLAAASGPLAESSTEQFTATIGGPANPITWSVDQIAGGNSTVGTISATGLYTAPSSATNHTITAAVATNPAISASTAVSVYAFTVSPGAATVPPSGSEQFSASIQNLAANTVTWSVNGVAGGNPTTGTISASGLYSAPGTIGAYSVTATSTADTSASASATLTVINAAQAAVLTYHNDDARDGAYLNELSLTPSNVNMASFGKLFSYPVDGQIYAQPLYLSHVNIAGGTHDVVFVETQSNSVYAFDADATTTATTFWHLTPSTLGPSVYKGDLYGPYPNLGILSTPVIDATTNIIYFVVETSNTGPNGTPFFLYAVDALTGTVINHVPINATDPNSSATLETSCYQRMGLALDPVTNWIYIPFGSCDNGWVLAYNKSTLAQEAVFNDTSNAQGGGLWASGGAPAIDDSNGNVYLMSGTDYDDNWINKPPTYSQTGYNDSFLNLNPTTLAVQSSFTPDDNWDLSANDADLGSGAAILVQGNSTYPKVLIGGGKDGNVYIVNPLNMGGFQATNDVLQNVQICNDGYDNIFSTPVYWNGFIYYHCNNNVLTAYSWSASTVQLSASPTSSATTANFQSHGATASLSANGATNGIIWDIDNTAYVNTGNGTAPCVLHAYDATNVANELYNSSQAGSRDTAGYALKFTVPTIVNGRVFVPTANELDIYGLLTP
jgi:hypothetical protein